MTAVRVAAIVELLAWPAIGVAIFQEREWLALLVAVPVGLFRVAVALQALRRG